MLSTMKLLALFFGVMILANPANAESPREQLDQMVEQLQKSPSDDTLREKVIKLAQGIKPALAIPEEARRSFVRGNTAFSEAKGQDDYARAVQRYEEALAIAPWWGDPYFNRAKALELQQDYGRAIQSLNFFVLTGPSVEDVRKAQDYSYALEDRQEKLSKEKSDQESVAAQKRATEDDFLIVPGKRVGRIYIGMKIKDAIQILGDPKPELSGRGKFEHRPVMRYHFGGNGDLPYAVSALDDSQEVVKIEVGSKKYHTAEGIQSDDSYLGMLARRPDLILIHQDNRYSTYCDPAGMQIDVYGQAYAPYTGKISQFSIMPNWNTICEKW